MARISSLVPIGIGLLLCATRLCTPSAMAQDKPPLSAEIQKVLDTDGPEAAKKRFNELYPAQKDAYEIDVKNMADLSTR